jgi:hypothetical protein
VLRLFLMPFCVSSFSALVKGRQFLLVFPPSPAENLAAFAGCGLFVAGVLLVKRLGRVS